MFPNLEHIVFHFHHFALNSLIILIYLFIYLFIVYFLAFGFIDRTVDDMTGDRLRERGSHAAKGPREKTHASRGSDPGSRTRVKSLYMGRLLHPLSCAMAFTFN